MRHVILGTAGHIDHGKTALVRALTGVETDRLKEERERGITIDLGFAELSGGGARLGVVDVPGHEGFVRNMLAGATGMGMALLVVAADEGVMPQTREHLAILALLGVPRLVVAVTKIDLVEEEWLELVEEEVRDVVTEAGFPGVPLARVSSRTGDGIDALRDLLLEAAREAPDAGDDLFALPVDRVFTIRGTGTVVTGTLLSGSVAVGDRLRLLPSGATARVRGLQLHGEEVQRAGAGCRTAVALAGDVDRESVARGDVLVAEPAWGPSAMLTVSFRVLPETGWSLAHNQRVRVHLGTAEVMARCVVFGADEIPPGGRGWGQLRLEAPLAARARQRGVLRSYSPVTTIAGIRVVEPLPPKRGVATDPDEAGLGRILDGGPVEAVGAVIDGGGAGGVAERELPLRTGLPPAEVAEALAVLADGGALSTPSKRWVGSAAVAGVRDALLGELDRVHRHEAYRPGVAVDVLRALLPSGAAEGLADRVLARLEAGGELRLHQGIVARSDFTPTLTDAQTRLRADLVERYDQAGLAPPFTADLPDALRSDPAFPALLAALVDEGALVPLDHELYIGRRPLDEAVGAIRALLGGREGLGPADFREALPVTRRHLLPILAWCDQAGVTRREGEGRAVPL